MASPLKPSFKSSRFEIEGLIASGSFGQVYRVYDEEQDRQCAMKIVQSSQDSQISSLINEITILEQIKGVGIPRFYYKDTQAESPYYVFQLLDKDLNEYFKLCNRKFTLKSICAIAIGILDTLAVFHDQGFIHRDLKPQNILVGMRKKENQIYLVDYGVSKPFLKPDGTHIEEVKTNQFNGTLKFCSYRAHFGYCQSRRDDLQSLAYILIYFAKGELPWDQSKTQKDVIRIKGHSQTSEITQDLPQAFYQLLHDARRLEYAQRPNYDKLKEEFQQQFNNISGITEDFHYDWFYIKQKLKYEDSSTNLSRQFTKGFGDVYDQNYSQQTSNFFNGVDEQFEDSQENPVPLQNMKDIIDPFEVEITDTVLTDEPGLFQKFDLFSQKSSDFVKLQSFKEELK